MVYMLLIIRRQLAKFHRNTMWSLVVKKNIIKIHRDLVSWVLLSTYKIHNQLPNPHLCSLILNGGNEQMAKQMVYILQIASLLIFNFQEYLRGKKKRKKKRVVA